jgi:hypothetical protein
MLVVLHSGQTGVERGAHRAAVAAGVAIAGFMPIERRDELGPVPPDVAEPLTPCFDRGPRPAVRANVQLATGVLVVVPDASQVERFTAMSAILQAIRSARVPFRAVDPTSSIDDVVHWVRDLPETSGSTRLLVTGPRETRWASGEPLARRIVTAIAMSS